MMSTPKDLIYGVGALVEAAIPGGVTVRGRIVERNTHNANDCYYIVENAIPGGRDGERFRVHPDEITVLLDSEPDD
jgi:hypothetical protein